MTSQSGARHKWPEFLLDLVHHTMAALQKAGLSSDSAQDIAIDVSIRMAEQWGGHGIYFPKGKYGRGLTCFKMEKRDREIYSEFNGTNGKMVCAKHGISRSRLYQIVAAIRRQRQAQLPPLARQNACPTP